MSIRYERFEAPNVVSFVSWRSSACLRGTLRRVRLIARMIEIGHFANSSLRILRHSRDQDKARVTRPSGRKGTSTILLRRVCRFSNSRNVTLGDRLYAATPFRWLGLAQRQAPWLSDGRKHPIARSVHAVRQASFSFRGVDGDPLSHYDEAIGWKPLETKLSRAQHFRAPLRAFARCRLLR